MSVKLTGPRTDDSSNSSNNLADCDITSYIGSCEFMGRIVPLAIANVLNNRCYFNPKHIKNFAIEDVSYVGFRSTIPRNHCLYPVMATDQTLKKYILKKHLKQIIIKIIKQNKEIEEYVFSLQYTSATGKFRRGRTAEQIAKNFFEKINDLQVNNASDKHQESEIKIILEWKFYNTMPKLELQAFFNPSCKSKDQQEKTTKPHVLIAKLKTRYHKLDVAFHTITPTCTPFTSSDNDMLATLNEIENI